MTDRPGEGFIVWSFDEAPLDPIAAEGFDQLSLMEVGSGPEDAHPGEEMAPCVVFFTGAE